MAAKREWLISIRFQLDFTQQDIADKTNISRSSYAEYEIGRRNPTVPNAQKIASVMGFDWTLFFAKESRNKRQKKIA
jgi:putative transcriptional regulator